MRMKFYNAVSNTSMRRWPWILFGWMLVASTANAAERPNILFFFIDDQRNDTLGCAGHPIVKTPNVDGLARDGVRFENAFVTTPICWISRATVLTGMLSRSHGSAEQIDLVNPAAASTIYPKLLQEAGYRNGFFGKWHAKMPAGFNQAQYFDVYEGISRNPYFKKQPDGSLRHETELIGDRAVDFLESQPTDKPFCLNLWFNAAHAEDGDKRPGIGHFPWPQSVDGMYEEVEIPAPRLGDAAIYESQPEFLKESLNRERYYWRWDTPDKYTTNMRAYFRMLSGIDKTIGRVLETLRARGLADNTLIVYSADNGYYMGDRGFAGKWSHYEQSIRVPMIIVDPRVPEKDRGRVETRMALNMDLPATFLELAGLTAPEQYQGRSLLSLVHNESLEQGPWRKDFLAEHLLEMGTKIPKWEGVRDQRYVYARYFENDYEFLHDLQTDPDQLKNLIDDPDYQDIRKRLTKRFEELAETHPKARATAQK